jgi:hypothetical protein
MAYPLEQTNCAQIGSAPITSLLMSLPTT